MHNSSSLSCYCHLIFSCEFPFRRLIPHSLHFFFNFLIAFCHMFRWIPPFTTSLFFLAFLSFFLFFLPPLPSPPPLNYSLLLNQSSLPEYCQGAVGGAAPDIDRGACKHALPCLLQFLSSPPPTNQQPYHSARPLHLLPFSFPASLRDAHITLQPFRIPLKRRQTQEYWESSPRQCTEAWGLRFKHCVIPSFSTAHSPKAEAGERRPLGEVDANALVARKWVLPEL